MSKTHLFILGMLNERTMYTYEFKKVIEERQFDRWAGIQLRSVYAAMDKLREKGFIVGEDEVKSNKTIATVYELTIDGKKHLKKLVEKALNLLDHSHEFWLGLAFIFGTTKEKAFELVEKSITRVRKEKARMEEMVVFHEENKIPIPANYQHLILFDIKTLSAIDEELSAMLMRFKNGENEDYFLKEKEILEV